MTSKLTLYNGALIRHLGENKLAAVTDTVPARYALDDVWDNGAVDTCLQAGQWNFAMRSVKIEYDPAITPAADGYTYALDRPSDLIRVAAVCQDGFFNIPLTDYQYDNVYWWANLDAIYVRYVSNDASYGGDYSLWPANFTRYVEAYLAQQSAMRIIGSDERKLARIDTKVKLLLREAKVTDAMENPSMPVPPGSWSSSRRGRSDSERGRKDQLIG